jgi:hypothetical protein
VPVGAYQIGQHLRIGGIGFSPRHLVTVAVPRHRQGVDRIHLTARRDQRLHPQATVCLDADHPLARLIDTPGDELMEGAVPANPSASRRAATRGMGVACRDGPPHRRTAVAPHPGWAGGADGQEIVRCEEKLYGHVAANEFAAAADATNSK